MEIRSTVCRYSKKHFIMIRPRDSQPSPVKSLSESSSHPARSKSAHSQKTADFVYFVYFVYDLDNPYTPNKCNCNRPSETDQS
jgi:hypothetical protein